MDTKLIKLAFHNKQMIEASQFVGCYHCLDVMKSEEIKEFTDDNKTGICPKCVSGNTEISTVFHGFQKISSLAEQKANERFPVYCYDFDKDDYSIGWAFNPHFVKTSETINILLENGEMETVTPDHQILTKIKEWKKAEELKFGDLLMPFHKVKPNQNHTKAKTHQFPRIYTHLKGWIQERQFIDEWRLNKSLDDYKEINKACQLLHGGLTLEETSKLLDMCVTTLVGFLNSFGFSFKEMNYLAKYFPPERRIIGVHPGKKIDVYDMTVEMHNNFCTKSLVMHNCNMDTILPGIQSVDDLKKMHDYWL